MTGGSGSAMVGPSPVVLGRSAGSLKAGPAASPSGGRAVGIVATGLKGPPAAGPGRPSWSWMSGSGRGSRSSRGSWRSGLWRSRDPRLARGRACRRDSGFSRRYRGRPARRCGWPGRRCGRPGCSPGRRCRGCSPPGRRCRGGPGRGRGGLLPDAGTWLARPRPSGRLRAGCHAGRRRIRLRSGLGLRLGLRSDGLGCLVGDIADGLARLGPGIGRDHLGQLGQERLGLALSGKRVVELGLAAGHVGAGGRGQLAASLGLELAGAVKLLLEAAEQLPGSPECPRCRLSGRLGRRLLPGRAGPGFGGLGGFDHQPGLLVRTRLARVPALRSDPRASS